MTRISIIRVLSLGALLLAGCGKSSSSEATAGLKDLAARAAKVYCGAMVKCQCTDSSAANDCETAFTKSYLEYFANVVGYQPSLKVDDTAAQKCLDDAQAELESCTGLAIPDGSYGPSGPPMPLDVGSVGSSGPSGPPPSAMPASCNEIFVGTQAEGDKCNPDNGDTDCAPGLGCNSQTHLCAQQGARGADCSYTRSAEGLYCAYGYAGPTCTDAIAEGNYCNGSDHYGQPDCAAGLECYWKSTPYPYPPLVAMPYPSEGDYVCQPKVLGSGAVCDEDAPCAAGFFCDYYSDTCKALKLDGVACGGSNECIHGWCNYALTNADGGQEPACADPGICKLEWFGKR